MKPTEKQLSFIESIEYYLEYYYSDKIKFKGNTKKKLKNISVNVLMNLKKVQREVDTMTRVEQENFGFLDF